MKKLLLFALLGIFSACEQKAPEHFGDFVDISKIDKVVMSNNSGTFEMNEKQLEMLQHELENLTPDLGSYKTGGISMTVTIGKKEYVLFGNTNGEYLECPAAMITQNKDYFGDHDIVYFKTNGVNFDNFKK